MNSTCNQVAAQIPSGFGMSTGGHAFAASTGTTGFASTTVMTGATTGVLETVVRDRHAVIAGRMGYAQKSLPWTTAWRPPRS